MKIDIQLSDFTPSDEPHVGNVYHVRGGRGLRYGHMMILFDITEPKDVLRGAMALMLIINKDGESIGVTSYGIHYLEDKQPIAFVEGLEDLTFVMRSL